MFLYKQKMAKIGLNFNNFSIQSNVEEVKRIPQNNNKERGVIVQSKDAKALYRINELVKYTGIGRTTIYMLNRKYHFIHKVGSISIIRWPEFEEVLQKEFDAEK